MVELTVTLPILLVLIFMTAEFGRAFMQYNTLTKYARDGARHLASEAVLGQTGIVVIDTDLAAATRNLAVHGDIAGTGSAVLPGLTTADVTVAPGVSAGDVIVSVAYTYDPLFLRLPLFGLGPDINPLYTFRTETTMRAL
jgi:Flp pilus assembly protein TadG